MWNLVGNSKLFHISIVCPSNEDGIRGVLKHHSIVIDKPYYSMHKELSERYL